MPTAPPEKHQRKPDVHTRQRDHRPRGVETGLGWPAGKPARHWLPVKPECHICLSPSSLIFQMKMPPPLTRGMKISPAIDWGDEDTTPALTRRVQIPSPH